MTPEQKKRRRLEPAEKIAALKQEIELLQQAQNQKTKTRLMRLHHDASQLVEQHKGQAWANHVGQAATLLMQAANAVPVPKEQ